MVARDPHRFANELDDGAIERIISRLESRARDEVFARLFDKYAGYLEAAPGGWGIMLDDAMAGVYAHLALRLLAWWRPDWILR